VLDLAVECAQGIGAEHRLRVWFAAVRVLLVVNPTASSVTPRVRADVERVLRAAHGVDVDVTETTRRDHAAAIARDAVNARYDVVAVLAGDGTLNEAGGGLVGSDVALAALPGGSTNVFARTLGVAYKPEPAARQLVDALARGSRRRIGVGVATAPSGPRHFLFHLGIGYDAAIIRRMEQHATVKRYLAHPAFAATALSTWFRHYDRDARIRFTIEPDGAAPTLVGEGPYAVISNSDPYAYVGRRPLRIAPEASLDDELTVTVLRTLRVGVVARAAVAAVGRTTYLTTSPEIVQRTHVAAIEIGADSPFPWQVDGDYLGEVERLDVVFAPDCLTVVIP
jgi:diacylglycerol kinase family enzyme